MIISQNTVEYWEDEDGQEVKSDLTIENYNETLAQIHIGEQTIRARYSDLLTAIKNAQAAALEITP